jgi:hypothetical protein
LLQGDRGRDARRRNYGERVDGPWIVGMIDANRQIRLFFVRDRSANTIIPLIRSVVKPGIVKELNNSNTISTIISCLIGSIIHTDGWAAYGGLGRDTWDDGLPGYQHSVVNHSQEFVSESGAHTQSIGRVGLISRSTSSKSSVLPRRNCSMSGLGIMSGK